MKTTAILFKIISAGLGSLMIMWGGMIGILGIAPGTVTLEWRIIGCIFFVAGILNCIPNHYIARIKPLAIAYLAAVSLPLAIILYASMGSLLRTGLYDFIGNGFVPMAILSIFLLLSPLSMALTLKMQKLEQGVEPDREHVAKAG